MSKMSRLPYKRVIRNLTSILIFDAFRFSQSCSTVIIIVICNKSKLACNMLWCILNRGRVRITFIIMLPKLIYERWYCRGTQYIHCRFDMPRYDSSGRNTTYSVCMILFGSLCKTWVFSIFIIFFYKFDAKDRHVRYRHCALWKKKKKHLILKIIAYNYVHVRVITGTCLQNFPD